MSSFGRSGPRDDDRVNGDGLDGASDGAAVLSSARRLSALKATGLFSSDLSVKEFAVLGLSTIQTVAQVSGASVVQVGPAYLPPLPARTNPYRSPLSGDEEPSLGQRLSYAWNTPVMCELPTVGSAWAQARRSAFDQIIEEARSVKADAVIGARLIGAGHDVRRGTVEVQVSGTAIRFPGAQRTAWPILTHLSGQELWQLSAAGYEPTGLLITTAVWFVSLPRALRLRGWRSFAASGEMPEVTQAFTRARDDVRHRLKDQLRMAHGLGVVGTELSHTIVRERFHARRSTPGYARTGWGRDLLGLPIYRSNAGEAERSGWMITVHAAGTAIGPNGRTPQFETAPIMGMRS